ncbi:hypothetical protein OXX80_002426 [Metschnikowia pulcherrima]
MERNAQTHVIPSSEQSFEVSFIATEKTPIEVLSNANGPNSADFPRSNGHQEKTTTIHSQESTEGVAEDDESNFISPSPESSHSGGGGSAEHQPAQPPVTQSNTESTEENQNSKNIENSPKTQPLSETLKAKPAVGIFRQFRFGPGERKASTNKTPEDIRRSDLKFISSEFKPKKWGENANFKSIQAKRLIEKKSKNANFFDILNGLPEGDHSVKVDLKNQFDIPVNNIEDALDAHFMQAKGEYLEEYKKISSSLGWIPSQKDSSEVEMEESPDSSLDSEGERFQLEELKAMDAVTAAVACIFLANARVIKNKVYMMGAKSRGTITFILSNIAKGFQKRSFITERSVSLKISELILGQQFFDREEPSKFFSLETSPISSGNFMWVTVAHFRMADPQEYYEQVFLTPLDRVIAWVPNPGASNEKIQVDVMLDLGSDKIPPRRLIMDRQKQHFEYLMKHSQGLELIEADREVLKKRLASEGENVSPETQRFKESIERAMQIYKEKRDDLQHLIDSSKEEKQFEVREDPAQMTCVIEFSNQYCPICHTTDHSLNKCAVKGCSLCLHKKHPFYKCPEKCKCARRPVHLADRCPAKQAPKPIFQMPMLSPPKPHWASPGKHTTCDYNVLNIEPTSEEEASSRTSKPVSPIQKSPISSTKGATMVNSSKSIFGQKEGTATSSASGSQASWARA